jgi:glycosyltransferase involved in cell wall biosynthesis
MKILWLAHRDPLNPKAGGAERTILEVCTRLVNKNYKITMLTGGWNGCKQTEELQGIRIYRFGKNVGPHLALPIFLLKNRYNIVVNDLGHAVPWISSTILNKHNIVFFRHLHARSLHGQVNPIMATLLTAIERCYFILYHETVFVTESTTSKNDLLKLEIKEDKIIMNPPGVDQKLFHSAAKSKYPTLVYFGGMRKYKRPLEILYLLKSLLEKREDIKLFVIGTGPEEKSMKRLANELNVQNYVKFTGRISSEELSDIVASSWLNVHTSVTEGWGLSILEASSAGTPTVAYDVPGVGDAVEDGLNGIKVKDGNRKALAEAAFSILTDPERWWSSSVEVAQKYSWDKTAELWETLIKEITDERYNKLGHVKS